MLSISESLVNIPKRFIGYPGYWMMRDLKRREMVVRYSDERLRWNALKRAEMLPLDIRKEATEKLNDELPVDSRYIRLINRCALTSRSRGNVRRYRLSRMMWRHEADYNKLAGVVRAKWAKAGPSWKNT
ncbi:hypothetical protein SNEBB_009754 [Seison nebaliae]|nr:hypothetical protein SNEBB_009754 [Seison nebaliae]